MLLCAAVVHAMVGRCIEPAVEVREPCDELGVQPGLIVKGEQLKADDEQRLEAKNNPWQVKGRREQLVEKGHAIGGGHCIGVGAVMHRVVQSP